jgi:hypothetical protein
MRMRVLIIICCLLDPIIYNAPKYKHHQSSGRVFIVRQTLCSIPQTYRSAQPYLFSLGALDSSLHH